MKKITPFVLFAVFTCPAWLQGSQMTIPATRSPSTISCVGYLPYPCAAQHLAVRQESGLNVPINNTGAGLSMPAGTIFIDPDFGERTVRVTDINTLPTCFNSTTQNTAIVAPGNPDLSIFSSDSQWFRVSDGNNNYWLYKFYPATMQVTCEPTSTDSLHSLPWAPIFGRTPANAGIAFGTEAPSSGTPWVIQSLNVTNPGNTAQMYYDFSTCPGLGWLTSMPAGSMQWYPGMFISNDDNRIEWTFGSVQNEGWLTAIYDKAQNECTWVDSRTGQIGGNLTTTGQMTGAFPLDWSFTRPPVRGTVSQATAGGGGLISGHTYDICYSVAWETIDNGVGETSCSPIQRVTISGPNNALSTPSPSQCTGYPNCDLVTWNYYNVYANDEANCGGAECSYSQMYLQPAANLGCTQTVPSLSVSHVGTAGSTTYSYLAEVWGPHCMTFASGSTTSGNATLSSSNYNSLSVGSISGATWYRFTEGGKGNSSVWNSTVYGSASVDAASSSGGGSVMMPAIIQESSSTTSYNDKGGEGLALEAMGTIPCYNNMPSGSGWSQLFSLIPTSSLWNCNNNTTLTALTTSGTPLAPTKSTLGFGIHAATFARSGTWMMWSSQANNGSEVMWNLGSTTVTMCNVTASVEYPTANAYTQCPGHGATASQGQTQLSAILSLDPNFEVDYHNFSSFGTGAAINLYGTSTWPALDPNGIDYYDSHVSWNNNNGVDANSAQLISTEAASGATLNSFQGPLYIGRGLAREVYLMNPNGTFSRFAHHRASGVPYYDGETCLAHGSGWCETYGWESQAAISDDGHFALYQSDMSSSLGCDPTQSFPITAVTIGNPTTVTISIPIGSAAPLSNQVGTVVGTSGVAGLNGQWTITGTSPNFTLSGSNLAGTVGPVTGAQFQECTYNGAGQVNGPPVASNCGTGSQTCKAGMALRSVFITELK
jgi:hypothetical protein